MLRRNQIPILIILAIAIIFFSFIFLSKRNYEFIGYVGVIIIFSVLIALTNKRVNFPNFVLWGLLIWALLHMVGGGLKLAGQRVYEIILIPIVGDPYFILRYDQFVHAFGFAVATLAMFYLIRPLLAEKIPRWTALSIVVVMAGLGVGALNEIIEFSATVILPSTGVGGYVNTSLDLVADLIGAILALVYILWKEK